MKCMRRKNTEREAQHRRNCSGFLCLLENYYGRAAAGLEWQYNDIASSLLKALRKYISSYSLQKRCMDNPGIFQLSSFVGDKDKKRALQSAICIFTRCTFCASDG